LKPSKLIREIKKITDNPDLHFWIKCKELTKIKTYNRPGSQEGGKLIRFFFETCAGRFKNRFESAYVRPYLDNWRDDYRAYDYVNKKDLSNDLACKIGRHPRGIVGIARKLDGQERFANYIKAKYPNAFEEFEEIKKVSWFHGLETKETSDCAWQHIFGNRVSNRICYSSCSHDDPKALWRTPKETQLNRRKFDLAMEQAQADYNELKKASGLPPRYLYNEVSLAELQDNHKNHTYAIFKKHYITTSTVLHYDSSKVSHGLGKQTHTDRSISIKGKSGPDITWNLKAYAGNFVLNAIEERFGRVKKVKVTKKLKPVQLNPKMEIIEIANNNGIKIFKRMFARVHYDYCAFSNKTTYHATSIQECVTGWEKKKTLSTPGVKIINMKFLRELGFCSTGIKQFCATNNIDSRDDYTVKELKTIVKKNLRYNKNYYGRELRQVGIL
jgi:hypothetical protein